VQKDERTTSPTWSRTKGSCREVSMRKQKQLKYDRNEIKTKREKRKDLMKANDDKEKVTIISRSRG
jgi:hypothetical protein